MRTIANLLGLGRRRPRVSFEAIRAARRAELETLLAEIAQSPRGSRC